MFGFQRVGDLIWAAADQRARGFLIGATSGRTTLGGEGLQHQDGSSHLSASTIPNCRAYDPAFAGELAVIIQHGARRMLEEQVDEFYYITVTNENVHNPSLPEAAHDGVLRGMYLLRPGPALPQRVQLFGSGAIMGEVLQAAALLEQHHGVAADVRALPELVRAFVPPQRRYVTLGTDGFGRSDSRAALRAHFEVDARAIVQASLRALNDVPGHEQMANLRAGV
jgi:pyruvate dehydrogenase E1 component